MRSEGKDDPNAGAGKTEPAPTAPKPFVRIARAAQLEAAEGRLEERFEALDARVSALEGAQTKRQRPARRGKVKTAE
jgi:hypothetical protein